MNKNIALITAAIALPIYLQGCKDSEFPPGFNKDAAEEKFRKQADQELGSKISGNGKICSGLTPDIATDMTNEYWPTEAGHGCAECLMEGNALALKAFDMTPGDNCFKTPLCKWGADQINPANMDDSSAVETLIFVADAITCLQEPNSDQVCRNLYAAADDASGKFCGASEESQKAARQKWIPEGAWEPCKDINSINLLNPSKWEDLQCDSCVLVNAANFVMDTLQKGVCAELKEKQVCEWTDKMPTWAQLGQCLDEAQEDCSKEVKKVGDFVDKQCAFDSTQREAVKVALTKAAADPRSQGKVANSQKAVGGVEEEKGGVWQDKMPQAALNQGVNKNQ